MSIMFLRRVSQATQKVVHAPFSLAARSRSFRLLVRACLVAAFVAGPIVAPQIQIAQEGCTIEPKQGCFSQAKRDIAFLIDRSGSVENRGQTYNIEIEGVLRALRDFTVIPRDGSVAVAVILFNDAATVSVPLTEITSESDAERVARIVESLKCTTIRSEQFPCPFGATSYTAAIQAADINLSQERSKNPKPGVRRVFLMSTDGEPNDPDLGVRAAEQARVAATLIGIPFELDVILVGHDTKSEAFQASKAKVDQIVNPKPTTDLPGATFAINAGACSQEGADSNGDDCNRQANEFAELTRNVIRGGVAPASFVVNTEADTAPGATVATDGAVSLRQAIELANCNGGATTITFGNKLKDKTIRLSAPLDPITVPDVKIDGCAGNGEQDCTPSVVIDGGGQVNDGILIRSNRVEVRGLKIVNFKRAAITIGGACPGDNVGHNRIDRNTLENNPTGVLVLGVPNVRNTISRNNISRPTPSTAASATALIDLGGDGPTPNDAGDLDAGPNTLLNFTDKLSVTATGNTVTVAGQLNSPPPGGATVEIFAVTRFRVVAEKVIVDAVIFLAQTATDTKGGFTATNVTPSPTGIYTATVTDSPLRNALDMSSNTSELMFDSSDTPLPRPSASATSPILFGDVQLNARQTKPVVITNTGTAPLSITGCALGRCPEASADDRTRFTLSDCPNAKINPGESFTINVTFNTSACGTSRACLLLQTDDPLRPQIVSELSGTGTATARAVIQGGITTLKFKRLKARGRPRSNPPSLTFSIANTGCAALTLNSFTITRNGQTDDSGTFTIAPSGSQAGFPVTLAPTSTASFSVTFNPVIPRVDGTQPRVRDILPDDIVDTLSIQSSTNEVLTLTLEAGVKRKAQLIDPADTSRSPVVTLCRSGNELVVEFSAWDSDNSVNSVTYQFLDSGGQAVGNPITVTNLDEAIRARGIARGQSFTVSQRFANASTNERISAVRVTIFDGSSEDTATSGSLGAGCGASIQSLDGARNATVTRPVIRLRRAFN